MISEVGAVARSCWRIEEKRLANDAIALGARFAFCDRGSGRSLPQSVTVIGLDLPGMRSQEGLRRLEL